MALLNAALAQSKHIDVWYHVVWNKVREGRITITHLRFKNQYEDIVTKPVPQETFAGHCRYILGIQGHGQALIKGGDREKDLYR